jgi:hypothetical protein
VTTAQQFADGRQALDSIEAHIEELELVLSLVTANRLSKPSERELPRLIGGGGARIRLPLSGWGAGRWTSGAPQRPGGLCRILGSSFGTYDDPPMSRSRTH